ncbi:kinase [Chlamydia serpentis]|uniref:kinase n=1 Tax=Chlamydia serpentis TaxID=1967782 RepID=UPI000D553901|nr:kinase [Chlamydia serpentis]
MGSGNWQRCPFFFSLGSALGKGRGEQISIIKLNYSHNKYVLYLDSDGVSTQKAYQSMIPEDFSKGKRATSFYYGENDLEKSVFRIRPDLRSKKHMLERIWSPFHSNVLMSGSGATLFVTYSEKLEKNTQVKSHIQNLIKQTKGIPVRCLYRKNQWYSLEGAIYKNNQKVCFQPLI